MQSPAKDKPPSIVINKLKSLGYRDFEWQSITDDDGCRCWFSYCYRKYNDGEECFFVKVNSVTCKWLIEVLDRHDYFEILDPQAE